VFGTLQIAQGVADPAIIADLLSLLATVLLMVGATAVGVAVPALVFPARSSA
jgi:hypothetical protein